LNKKLTGACLAFAALVRPDAPSADLVAVRYIEGLVHGFLVLRTTTGAMLASGDLIQRANGRSVTSRLVFHFKDGSISEETAVFTQHGHFRLLSDHVTQKGPAFRHPMDLSIDVPHGQVTVRYQDEHGQQKTETEHLELPSDLANGLIITLLKNVRPNALPPSVSFIAATPKPRLVKLNLAAGDPGSFSVGGSPRRATHYVLKADIGGVAGLLAPVLGKEPPDAHVWVLEGEGPAFVKSEAPLYFGGPIVRTELTSPSWSRMH